MMARFIFLVVVVLCFACAIASSSFNGTGTGIAADKGTEEEGEGRRKIFMTATGYGTHTEKKQSNGNTVAAGDADGELRRRLTTVPMDQMRTGFDNTPAGGTVTFTEGTYTGTRMGSSTSSSDGIRKAATMECVLGDECVVDGQDDHRCLYIGYVNGAGERVTIKRIKLINGNTDVSAESN